MSPDQFLGLLRRQGPPPVALFLGPELWQRGKCRGALIERVLPEAEREQGFVRHDLDEEDMSAVLDDAQAFSLFAPTRLVWVSAAEGALPRRIATEDSDAPQEGAAGRLAHYAKNPTPGVTLVFDSSRFEFDGEDKARSDRVRKFYAAVPVIVEFQRYSEQDARELAFDLARRTGLKLGAPEIELLVEALGADASRIASEIEKLYLFIGDSRQVTADDITALVPNARATNVFALVAALGRGDRLKALDLLDTLVREGEYLPLVLTFLATQFRYALAAKEARLNSPQQIQAHFTKLGVPMWPARAQQVYSTVSAFSKKRIESTIERLFAADRNLRDARPDDRIVFEQFTVQEDGG